MKHGACLDCGRVGQIYSVDRCDRCWRRSRRDTPARRCPGCDALTMVWPETGLCGQCGRSQRLRARRHRRYAACGLQRRIAALDLCRRCYYRDADRPFRYGDGLAGRLDDPPSWLDDFVAFVAARFCVPSAVDMLRQLGALLTGAGSATTARLLVQADGSTHAPHP